MLTPIPIPALSDNYIWILRHPDDPAVIVIDPGESAPVFAAIADAKLEPAAILITHRHWDHVSGLADLVRQYPDIPVYGPAGESVNNVTHPQQEGDTVPVETLGVTFEVLDTPGHTAGHISFVGEGILACGDTLYAGGCGRVSECPLDQMYASLQKLAHLPADTIGCCGHEYTIANLNFAQAVEPGNRDIHERLEAARMTRAAGMPTVPFRMSDELETNPFLRCDQPEVRAAAEKRAGKPLESASEVFAVLRDWKNRF